jgi:hypothetical protein
MKITGICPSCEHLVEWQAIDTDKYKCSNCWHMINRATLDKTTKLAEDLAAHRAAGKKLFGDLL